VEILKCPTWCTYPIISVEMVTIDIEMVPSLNEGIMKYRKKQFEGSNRKKNYVVFDG